MDDLSFSKRLRQGASATLRRLTAWLLSLGGPGARDRADPARVRDVLVLRNDRLGDLVVSLGALRAIKRLNLDIRLHAVGSQWNRAYLDLDPLFETVHCLYTKKAAVPWRGLRNLLTLWRIRQGRYDVVLDMLHDNRKESNPLLVRLTAGNALRVGFGKGLYPGSGFHRFVPRTAARDRHAALEMQALVAEAFRIPAGFEFPAPRPWSPPQSEAFVREWMAREGLARYCVFNFSAGRADREYPVEAYVRVAGKLLAAWPDLRIVATSAPSERARPEAFAQATGSPRCRVFTGPLAHWSEFIRRSDLVVTPDTATAHLAAAWSRPVLGLYDAREYKEKVWYPFATRYALLFAGRIPDIPEADVVRAFNALYAEVQMPDAPPGPAQDAHPGQTRRPHPFPDPEAAR